MPIFFSTGETYEDEFKLLLGQQQSFESTSSQENLGKDSYLSLSQEEEKPPVLTKSFVDKLKETWPAKLVDSLIDTLKLPGDVYSGKVDLNSPEGSSRASEAALNLAWGGLAAAPFKPGIGMFGGRYSKIAVEAAESMEKKGYTEQTIKELTGLERGAEGAWRKEFSDAAAVFNQEGLKPSTVKFKNDKEYFVKANELGNVLKHDRLFATYPEARDIVVIEVPQSMMPKPSTQGLFSNDLNAIIISDKASKPLNTILHEAQHWIQHKEGFARGTVEDIPVEVRDQLKGHFIRKGKKALQGIKNALEEGYTEEAERLAHNLIAAGDYSVYRSLTPEVEAWNVEARMHIPEAKVRSSLAKDTELMPRSEQTIVEPGGYQVGSPY